MRSRKERLTVTVDVAYVKEAEAAVRAGAAASVSAWVNEAFPSTAKESGVSLR